MRPEEAGRVAANVERSNGTVPITPAPYLPIGLANMSAVRHASKMLNDCDLMAFVSTTDLDRARSSFAETIGLVLIEESPFAYVFDGHGTPLRLTLVERVHSRAVHGVGLACS